MKYLQISLFFFYALSLMSITTTSHSRGGMQIFEGPPTAPQCRNCHYNLKRFPILGLYVGARNPDRHHFLIGTIIPPISQSKAPDAIGAKNSGTAYDCFSCHRIVLNIETLEQEIVEPFRDCLQCHPAWRVTGGPMRGNNVHMENNTLFLQRNCQACHGEGQGIDTDGDGLSDWPDEPTSGGMGGGGGMGGRR